jgi:transposase
VAGTFVGLSDLEWKLFADLLPPEPTGRGRGLPHTPVRQVVNTWLYILITGCRWCDLPWGPPMGLQERRAPVAAAWASRWHVGRHASAPARVRRGTRHDSVTVRGRGWLVFPLAQAAVRASRTAAKAKVPSSTASQTPRVCRCPRARPQRMSTNGPRFSHGWTRFTCARVDEAARANGSRGLAADKGDDANNLRYCLRK